jgi:5-carboxymethyl-2-hydroxymuconate isomerase
MMRARVAYVGASHDAVPATSAACEDLRLADAEQFATQGLALSLELNEFSEAGTLKHNNLHARFKKS